MCILQLREDGELCEVVRRHRRDVNRLELLAKLAYRPPHKRPCANPRRSTDALHRGESHAAEVHRQPRLPQGALALRRGWGGRDGRTWRPAFALASRAVGGAVSEGEGGRRGRQSGAGAGGVAPDGYSRGQRCRTVVGRCAGGRVGHTHCEKAIRSKPSKNGYKKTACRQTKQWPRPRRGARCACPPHSPRQRRTPTRAAPHWSTPKLF